MAAKHSHDPDAEWMVENSRPLADPQVVCYLCGKCGEKVFQRDESAPANP